MTESTWTEALRDVDLFRDLPADSLARVADEMREYRYRAGEVVVKQGDSGHHGRMFVVVEGELEADVDGAPIASYGPGEEFGEMSLLDGGPRSATVTAKTDVVLAGLVSWNFRSVLVEEPTIAVHLIELLARRLREANARQG